MKVLSGKHYKKTGTTYTIVNDLVTVTSSLPRKLKFDEIAVLRHKTESKERDYQFEPFKVWNALIWLTENNHLYKHIQFSEWPENWKCDTGQLIDIDSIDLSDEEVNDLDEECEELIKSDQFIDLQLDQDKEVFLYSEQDIMTHEETVLNTLNANNLSLKKHVLHRNSSHEFVNPYYDPLFFWAKCFPWLYPYGYGCPSDPDNKLHNLRLHTKHMLLRGGGPQGRRFQQCPSYYFAAYHYESRRKLGGITSKANNLSYDRVDQSNGVTAGILSQMVQFAEESVLIDESNKTTNDDCHGGKTDELPESPPSIGKLDSDSLPKMTKQEFEFYSKRLAVYGKSLPGTALHMQNERCNLMSMLASPDVESDGIWRWFITFSPADLYDPRLYDILAATDEELLSWDEKHKKADAMSKEERQKLLALHPALAARLFQLQMQCLWDCVLGNQ